MLADNFRLVPRYNQWMNNNLYNCAKKLDSAALNKDYGGVFRINSRHSQSLDGSGCALAATLRTPPAAISKPELCSHLSTTYRSESNIACRPHISAQEIAGITRYNQQFPSLYFSGNPTRFLS